MFGIRTRFTVAIAVAALALSGCTSTSTSSGKSVATKSGIATATATTAKTQKSSPPPKASVAFGTKAAAGDVKLGVIHVDAKLGTPSAEVTIVNRSSKLSNYIIDLRITAADGKTQLDTAVVSAQRLSPGHTVKRSAHFTTKQKLPAGAKLTVIGIARLAA